MEIRELREAKKWPLFEKIEPFCQQWAIHWLSADNTEFYPSMAPTGAPRLKGTKKPSRGGFSTGHFQPKNQKLYLTKTQMR